MLSRLASALYSAVDALAPPLPLQEEFIWHWKAATKFYSEKGSSGKIPIELTSIPDHLHHMSSILEQEEEESESGNLGPCLEYLLQHKLLETMSLLARADTPPGMKRHVLLFVSRLLSNTKHSLLPQINVCGPMQNMIELCGEVVAAPSEREEISFLNTICLKLKENPYLSDCFLSEPAKKSGKSANSSVEQESGKNSRHYPLINSLLSLLQSPDSEITTKAGNCILLCTFVADDKFASIIVENSNLCSDIINRLNLLYVQVPKSLKPMDVDDAVAKWGYDLVPAATDGQIQPGKRRLLCFLRWLDFVDRLVRQSHTIIAEALVTSFQSEFLEATLASGIADENDMELALLTTTIISCCLRHISSPQLISSFGSFLLGEINEPEIPGYTVHALKHVLIQRCRNNNAFPQLGMATLQLFEELLLKPTDKILNNLILSNLQGRGYYDTSAGDSYFDFSEEEESAHRQNHYEEYDDSSPGSSPVGNTFAPTHIHRILNCFLLLVPDEIKSCDSEEDSGYDTYINDAHRQFQECLVLCEHWNWPQDLERDFATLEDDSSSDSQPEADSSFFYEGEFLSMIFDKLEQMLEQPYEVNLQITSLVSKISLYPHPNLHEYLLNPLIPLTLGSRSLFTVLLKVVEEIQVNMRKIPNFKKKLSLTRRALLSEAAEYNSFEESSVLEALIVVEEFCKELAAVAFVKYHAAAS